MKVKIVLPDDPRSIYDELVMFGLIGYGIGMLGAVIFGNKIFYLYGLGILDFMLFSRLIWYIIWAKLGRYRGYLVDLPAMREFLIGCVVVFVLVGSTYNSWKSKSITFCFGSRYSCRRPSSFNNYKWSGQQSVYDGASRVTVH